jgi:hypothetical protein
LLLCVSVSPWWTRIWRALSPKAAGAEEALAPAQAKVLAPSPKATRTSLRVLSLAQAVGYLTHLAASMFKS